MSHDDVVRRCVPDRMERTQSWQKEQARKDQTEQERGTVEKEPMNGQVARRSDGGKLGGKKGSEGSNSDWHGDKHKGSNGSKGKGERETRYCYDSGAQGYMGVKLSFQVDQHHR